MKVNTGRGAQSTNLQAEKVAVQDTNYQVHEHCVVIDYVEP